MRPFSPYSLRRAALLFAIVGLAVAVGAMGVHALVHSGFDSAQQCQVCHLSHGAAPIPALELRLEAPITFSAYSAPAIATSIVEPICEHRCPRAPPV